MSAIDPKFQKWADKRKVSERIIGPAPIASKKKSKAAAPHKAKTAKKG